MNKRKLHELNLFCRAGIGLEAIAPSVCRVLRELVGAEAAALFWMDEHGLPVGFHHEDSPNGARDLFVNEFERLFVGGAEINVSTLSQIKGAPIGHLLAPESAYFRSNTYNLLVRPSGHHHALDLRVDIDGRARAIVILFRSEKQSFTQRDAAVLAMAETALRRAIADPVSSSEWQADGKKGHLVVSSGGQQLMLLGGDAEAILKGCTLVGQGIRLDRSTTEPPAFVRELCARLTDREPVAHHTISVPAGRVQISAERLQQPANVAMEPDWVLVTLEQQMPNRLRVVERVLTVGLSPVQQQIALVAATGGSRLDSMSHVGLSNEALKKHLAVIYARFEVNGWDALGRVI